MQVRLSRRGAAFSSAAAAALGAAFLASSAQAADAAGADGAAAAADGAAPGLTEVVVTAERRLTNAQKTPTSISVVNAQAIEDRHVFSLTDLNDGAAPGLTVTPYASRPFNVILAIRGVGIMTDTNQPAGESGIGVYVDGVYLGRPQGLDAGLYDLQAIEVLKGPQGTLFGRNTEGGALNITTKKPTGKFSLEEEGGVGNYGSYESQFHLNLPEYHNVSIKLDGLVQSHDGWVKNPMPGQSDWNLANRRGVRVQVRWKPFKNLTVDYAGDIGHDEDTTVFGYTVRPANNVTISPLSPIVTHRIDTAPVGAPLQPSLGDQWGHSLTVRWEAAPWLEIKSISAYRHLYQNQYQEPGTEGLPITVNLGAGQNFERYSLAQFKQHQYSEEVQAIGTLDRLKFIAGAIYFNERTIDQAQAFNVLHWDTNGVASGITPITYTPYGNSVLGPNACTTTPSSCFSTYNNYYGQPGQTTLVHPLYPNVGVDRASQNVTDSYGIYGQATYTPPVLGDRLHLTAGVRWNDDQKHGQLLVVNNALPFLPNAAGQLTTTQGVISHEKGWQRIDPMFNVAYDLASSAFVYAKWGSAYRAGGFDSRSITYSIWNPEEIQMSEVGFKSEFFQHRLRFNIDGYYGDYKNVFYPVSANYNTFNTNAQGQLVVLTGSTRTIEDIYNMKGTGRVHGFESEVDLVLLEGLTVSGTYAYAEEAMPLFTDPVPRPQINAAGIVTGYALNTPTKYHQLYTPRNRITAEVNYQRPVFGAATFRVHVDGNWNDGEYTSSGDVSTGTKDANGNTIYLQQLKSQAGAIFNGRMSIGDIQLASTGARLTLTVWARNLFDTNQLVSRSGNYALPSSSITGSFNDPRTFGGTVSVKF